MSKSKQNSKQQLKVGDLVACEGYVYKIHVLPKDPEYCAWLISVSRDGGTGIVPIPRPQNMLEPLAVALVPQAPPKPPRPISYLTRSGKPRPPRLLTRKKKIT